MAQQEKWSPGTECLAKFNFEGSTADDLSFKKGEIVFITKATKDPNWYRARNEKGQEGMIPANYVQKREGVKRQFMPWFHGKISREKAEELLQPCTDGLFLVRESTNFPGDYTLCVGWMGHVEHYHILYDNNKLTIDEERYFENLTKLVEHYEEDSDGLCSRLIVALAKKGELNFSINSDDFVQSGWAINRKNIQLGDLIGKGNFGDVRKGNYMGRKVAIKQLKDDSKAAQTFLAEASVMTKLRHPNLVQLMGVVLPSGQSPLLIVLEFMEKGNLVDYLRSRGRTVIKQPQLLKFAGDVASAMAYLESQNIVHRDLAARNVLISERDIAKVADFGLSKDAAITQQGIKFPIKWTAPEALRKNLFSVKSDVWSFGILIWELYSFGKLPYPKLNLTVVVEHIENGYRMTAPESCPDSIYKIMQQCWDIDPRKRPSFEYIHSQLSGMMRTL
ncbi:tyrosine-protein kinase CSK-like isoform X2 [Acanthaster planci]|uniref:Tyrosine-protein kinase n=1 Tax=Acanthaster planci TaxID=133434 RepID=A0A8B7YVP9_ACAPL|nr:tyrosine-protein kinase CSK-like isoform X2 [Acanthaster planci]